MKKIKATKINEQINEKKEIEDSNSGNTEKSTSIELERMLLTLVKIVSKKFKNFDK